MADVANPATESAARKKFATPPVKLACLSCRTSRTRCNGGRPCATCVTKSLECNYRPSRRGGPRFRKKPSSSSGDARQTSTELPTVMDTQPLDPLPFQSYIDPGAGLSQLQDSPQDSDFIFDSLFIDDIPDLSGDYFQAESAPNPDVPPPLMVRTYRSDQAILEAYYIWIHPFFPILPPPESCELGDQAVPLLQNKVEEDFEPATPISLAISAILALIPCAEDGYHQRQEAVMFRRRYAHFLAQAAIESIEMESEIPDSSIEPTRALNESPEPPLNRIPFHNRLPVELESIVALDILSVYEYAQRGNLKKMRSRASQAFASAMMSFYLHNQGSEDDFYSEARRRVWWMTFICACQGSIVSNTPPSFDVFAPTFTTSYPVLESDPEAWPMFVQSQRAILTATQFVMELNATVKAQGDMNLIYDRMKELEIFIAKLIEEAEAWTPTSPMVVQVEPTEQILSQSLRAMSRIKLNSARIKIHRYCAFFDLPVFSQRHCDLKSTDANGQEPKAWPSCGCSSMNGFSPDSSGTVSSSPGASAPATSTATLSPKLGLDERNVTANLPFTSHHSARVCLKSALSIAQAFDCLPYPNPPVQATYFSLNAPIMAPRTMPSFACCAMQSAYSLLMVHHKTKSLYPSGSGNALAGSMLLRLQQGLTSICAALENYALAFEALGGMRDQIRTAVESSMASD